MSDIITLKEFMKSYNKFSFDKFITNHNPYNPDECIEMYNKDSYRDFWAWIGKNDFYDEYFKLKTDLDLIDLCIEYRDTNEFNYLFVNMEDLREFGSDADEIDYLFFLFDALGITDLKKFRIVYDLLLSEKNIILKMNTVSTYRPKLSYSL